MDADSSFSLSQPSATQSSYPKIFVDEHENSYRLFVEASKIQNRPKIVRLLKNHGATICVNPKEAQIILVDSSSDAGLQFIREWGTDPNKTVLEYTWARRSVDEGRPLLAGDEWGGCMARDDGRPLGSPLNERTSQTPNPLPTPRPTPTEAGPSSQRYKSRSSPLAQPGPSTQPQYSPGPSTPIQSGSSQQQQHFQSQNQPQYEERRNSGPPPTPSPQYSPANLQPFQQYAQPVQMPMQPPPHLQQNMPHAPSPLGNMQFPQQMQPNGPFNLQMNNPFAGQANGQLYGQPNGQYNQQISPFNGQYNGQFNGMPQGQYQGPMNGQAQINNFPPEFFATMMDVLKYHTGAQQGLQMSPFAQNQIPMQQYPNAQHANGSEAVYADSPSSETLPPSIKRRSSPPIESSKGKRKASHSSRRGSASSVKQEPLYPGISSHRPSSSSQQQPQPSGSTNPGSGIFRSAGKPLSFFIQIDLKARKPVVQAVKRCGGVITSQTETADFVILNRHSTTFNDLLSQARHNGKDPIQPSFVHDCEEQGALLDWEQYILQGLPSPLKKRAATKSPKKPTVKVETGKKTTTPKSKISPDQRHAKLLKDKARIVKKTEKEQAVAPPSSYIGSPSPTPPPDSSRQELPSGKHLFTPSEKAYAEAYARHNFKGDPTMSATMFVKKLYRKMPHHSQLSWQSYIASKVKLDVIRQDVKAQLQASGEHAEASNLPESQEGGSSKRPRLDDANESESMMREPVSQGDALEFEEADKLVIVQFFLDGGGDNLSDDDAWAALEKAHKCRSAHSWPAFYAQRQNEIEALMRSSVDDDDMQGQSSEEDPVPSVKPEVE
ncbi:hypothetical protein PLICRDRAFT_175274 [Plicaturopsis crispa FD-325 SS-3]|nr:hypothetical protein PLICRDRAFT_175274 [Plicaturopsis crispa FD-325 SS-3]